MAMGSITRSGRRSRSLPGRLGGISCQGCAWEVLPKHVGRHRSGEQLTCPIQQVYVLGALLAHELSAECDFN